MHEVTHEDSAGELVDVTAYCSDSCARADHDYAGWNGCVEGSYDEWCAECGARVGLDLDGPCDDSCFPVVVNVFPGHEAEPCEHGIPRYLSMEGNAR